MMSLGAVGCFSSDFAVNKCGIGLYVSGRVCRHAVAQATSGPFGKLTPLEEGP